MQGAGADNSGYVLEKIALLSEVSRHYDSTLWTVTSIWAAALGGLLVYCVENPDNIWLIVLGLLFTVCPMFFARGFREIRRRVHTEIRNLSPEIAELHVSHAKIHQWDAFCVIFLGLAISWTYLLFDKSPDLCWLWTVLSLIVVLVICIVWKISRGDTRLPCNSGSAVRGNISMRHIGRDARGWSVMASTLLILTCLVLGLLASGMLVIAGSLVSLLTDYKRSADSSLTGVSGSLLVSGTHRLYKMRR